MRFYPAGPRDRALRTIPPPPTSETTRAMHTFLLLCVLALPFVLVWLVIAALTVIVGRETSK
jgi:hypothetical protein